MPIGPFFGQTKYEYMIPSLAHILTRHARIDVSKFVYMIKIYGKKYIYMTSKKIKFL